jgi:hypothetical protein
LRYVLWFACLDLEVQYVSLPKQISISGDVESQFPKWAAEVWGCQQYFQRFGTQGKDFGLPEVTRARQFFCRGPVPVNFDPPWTWPAGRAPTDLFHSPPPPWYDPWGYNRPGDFVTSQPSPTYLDPFCFDGHLKLPHRPVKFDDSFKGRAWAVFAENDPASLLANAPTKKDGEPEEEPVMIEAGPDPDTLIVLTDELQHCSTLQLFPPKSQRVTFDANTHKFQHEATTLGTTNQLIVGPPTVFLNPARTFPTAWCVVNPISPTVRLRKLVTFDSESQGVPWDLFVDENKGTYGPRGGGKTWQIDVCPLPAVALPQVVLDGYGLPAS